jgi:hypothetical protein
MASGYQRLAINDEHSVPIRTESFREEHRRGKEEAQDRYEACKNFAFVFIAILTAVYTIAELGT